MVDADVQKFETHASGTKYEESVIKSHVSEGRSASQAWGMDFSAVSVRFLPSGHEFG